MLSPSTISGLKNIFHAKVVRPQNLIELMRLYERTSNVRIVPMASGQFAVIVEDGWRFPQAYGALFHWIRANLKNQQAAFGLIFRSRSSVAFKCAPPP